MLSVGAGIFKQTYLLIFHSANLYYLHEVENIGLRTIKFILFQTTH